MKKLLIIITLFFVNSIIYSQNFILVHGWKNYGTIWDGTSVKDLITSEFAYSNIYQPSLGGSSPSYYQSMALRDYLNTYNINNGAAISYSMGGINVRYYLRNQYDNNLTQRLSYNFTIGTPHLGAQLANNAEPTVKALLLGLNAILSPLGYLDEVSGNIIVYYAYNSALYLTQEIFYNYILYSFINDGAFEDLKVGSLAEQYVNPQNGNYYENGIGKVSIVCTENYPQLYRMGAAAIGISENESLNIVDGVQAYLTLVIFNAAINYAENQTPQNFEAFEASLANYSFFKELPDIYNNFIGGSGNDGIVSKETQFYPNYNHNYFATGANHLEELNHINVQDQLRNALLIENFQPKPLTASIFGDTYITSGQNGTWTAYPDGGYQPYTYNWWYRYPGGIAKISSINKPPAGYWNLIGLHTQQISRTDNQDFEIKCVVTDNQSNTVTSNIIYVYVNGGLSPGTGSIIAENELIQNFPNPFNPSTEIKYALKEDGFVTIKVYDVLGRVAATLVNENKQAGFYKVSFDASNLSSGVYFYTIKTNDFIDRKKMILLR